MPLPPHNYDTCINTWDRGTSRVVYKYINQNPFITHNKYLKWSEELGGNFCQDILQFEALHKNIYKVTNVAKYRSFQYRLLQRGLVTNIQLKLWNISDTDLCYFCNQERETVSHMMYSCPVVRDLWTQMEGIFNQYCKQEDMNITDQSIISNSIVKPVGHVVNFMCLLTKQFIYKQKCLKQTLHFPLLRDHIRRVENIEKYIAVNNGKLGKHLKKWLRI